jgi:glycosyltransferase involved in cell wall biosynthesis
LSQTAARKKILVLTSTFPRWKDDVEPPFVYELCRRLGDVFNVHVLAPHAPGAAIEEQLDGIKVSRYRYFFSRWESLAYHGGILANLKQNPLRYGLVPFLFLAQLLALYRLLCRQRYDCIHAHWLIPQGLMVLVVRFLLKSTPPLIVTSHGGDLYGLKGYFPKRLKRYVAQQSTVVTVVSLAMMEVLQELGVDKDRVRILPMGVDLRNRFKPPARRRETGVILFVGRLVEKKGLLYLIEALPSILKKYPDIILRVVGDGQEKKKIERRLIELGLGGNVEFLGAVPNDDLPDFYGSSDVIVFPSVIARDGDREGFGLVLVEALGCECAAVVTDLPAMRNIVRNDISALVVPQKDTIALAEKVCCLLGDENLRHSLGKQGRAHVLKMFDWEIITRQYTDLICSIIK